MIPGFNHNIPYRGQVFHVQTELSELGEPHLATHVFLDGRIVASRTTGCADFVISGIPSPRLLPLLKEQQKDMIRELLTGQFHSSDNSGSTPGRSRTNRHRRREMPWKNRWRQVVASAGGAAACSEALLSVRRSVVRLRRAVVPGDPPALDDLDRRLKRIATSIAVLVGKSHGELLRDEELADLLMLRSEAIAWISQGGSAGLEPGLVIWQGFDELSEKLMRVNDRENVSRHDQQVLTEVSLRLFESAEPPDLVDDDTYDLLQSVYGCDEEIDGFLERPEQVRLARLWEIPVKRILLELGIRLESSRPGVCGSPDPQPAAVAALS